MLRQWNVQTFGAYEQGQARGRREQGWLNPSTPRRSSYLPQRDVGILYAGGGEQWGYSAGCKLMVSPWHDGGWARPKGSAWSMDGVCAGSNGSCHDTRRSLAKTVSPPIGSKIDILLLLLLLSTRDVRVRVLSCGIRRRVSLPAGPFHALSIPVIDTIEGGGRAKERSKQPSRLWDAKAITFSLFMRGRERKFRTRNARYD